MNRTSWLGRSGLTLTSRPQPQAQVGTKGEARRRQAAGFTLVELLIVVAIIGAMMAMIVYQPRGDRRNADVAAAAQELASTLRAARSRAMDERGVYAVAFNIRNGLGTTGRVLNNFDGGHWYRMVGVAEVASGDANLGGVAAYPSPSFQDWNDPTQPGNPNQYPAGFLELVKVSWSGDRHVLPARRVRFLALGDQDNGAQVDAAWPYSDTFVATYPRPWFGWYDAAAGRLYPWGGYDATIKDRYNRPCSGFYFQGADGPITGCANPANRSTTWDTAGVQIFAAGSGRPLVNGDWLDDCITFYPDGTARPGPLFAMRYQSWFDRNAGTQAAGNPYTGGHGTYGDVGDMIGESGRGFGQRWYDQVVTNYTRHTGDVAITLAPDADRDSDSFGTAKDALASLMPAYRVMVNHYGLVRVVKVVGFAPAGTTFDTTITSWQTNSQLKTSYLYNYATNADGSPRGRPATDFVSEAMLANHTWWMP